MSKVVKSGLSWSMVERAVGAVMRSVKPGAGGSDSSDLPPLSARFMPDLAVQPVRPASAAPTGPVEVQAPRHPSLCDKPAISVVLGSFNRADLLRLAVDSTRTALEGFAGEIVVIDGGSTDGSVEWLSSQPDIITIVQNNRFQKDGKSYRRKSWGAFMNIAFRAAVGQHVLMISDDCLLAPDAVRNALDRIAAAQAAGLRVGACAFYFRNWPEEDRYYVQRTIGGNLMVNHGLYSKEALEAVGYANEEDYVFYKADSDLSLRIWKAGYVVIDSPGSVCEHYIGVAEAVREGNNAVMDYDREQMRRLWSGLTDKPAIGKMGKIYLDAAPGKLADAWRDIRKREIAKRP